MWCGNTAHSDLRLEDSQYFASCNDNLLWPAGSFELAELTEEDFTPRAPIRVSLCW